MKSKKIVLVGILVMMLLFLTGCGTEKNEENTERKEENSDNVVVEKDGSEEQKKKISNSNVGTFVEYNGDIYYWKMDSGSREESSLFAKYTESTNYKNNLVKLQPDGTETVILSDAGAGKICIANDTIFYESRAKSDVQVCSINLDGKEKREYKNGFLKYIVDNYIYIQSQNDISIIDVSNKNNNFVVETANIVGVAGKNVYYTKSTSNGNVETMEIGYINGTNDSGIVASFNSSEYSDDFANEEYLNVTFLDFTYRDNKVMIDVGFVAGTGHFVQEGWTISMDADGKNVSKNMKSDASDVNDSLLEITDKPVKYSNGLVYTDKATGKETTLLSKDELVSKLGFKEDDDGTYGVYSADVIGDEIYVTIDSGTHNPSEDIGWRYSYKRVKTIAFKYNLKENSIEKIYEF